MPSDFKLKIEDFGPVSRADLDISKINILTGKNASGKSTIGKLLYCIFTSFSTDGQYFYDLIDDEFFGAKGYLNNSKIAIYHDDFIVFYLNSEEDYPITYCKDSINADVLYIETPFLFDYMCPLNHQWTLHDKLTDFTPTDDELSKGFQDKIKDTFNVNASCNSSSGLNSIEILLSLLKNGKLNQDSFLIMDGPEGHLHPEWQVRLAEILVLMVRDLNLSLFINSYSPIFIEAMEVFSVKYRLKNESRFYMTEKDENSDKYHVIRINYNNLHVIYNDLGDSYDIIDKVRGENLARNVC